MSDILLVAQECKNIIENEITINRDKYILQSINKLIQDVCITGKISKLEKSLRLLADRAKSKYPLISSSLMNYIEQYDQFPIRYLGRIEAIVECLISLENQNASGYKVFISHSSKDKPIVEDFVNHILMLGIGIDSKDIFCTSIEDMNIRNGKDIRQYIHKNIAGSECSILLLSDNYKASEICQNEMGAVWISNAIVRYFLLPNFTAEKIGWLVNPNQAETITNAVALDNLRIELSKHFNLNETGIWSSQREQFLFKHK